MADPYIVLWIFVMVCAVVLEASTMSLVSIWFAIGAIVPIITAKIGFGIYAQTVGFLIASGLLVAFMMPLTRKYIKSKNNPTNADRIIGAEGVVIAGIDEMEGTGQIKVMGAVWSAKCEDGKILKEGTRVTVKRIEGVKAIVEEKKQ
jgi:membrane protein implicated in regulation of membrane protease activity